MKFPSSRSMLALVGASLSVLATAQSLPDFYLPDDSHLLLFTSAGTFALSNEQKVSWQVDPEQEKAFEAWRKALPTHPETSALVKDLLGKNKKHVLKQVGSLTATPLSGGSMSLKFDFANNKPSATLTLSADANGKDWSPENGSGATLGDVAEGLGLKDRKQLEPALRTAGDGGKPWTHLVRLLERSPQAYLAVGHTGVLSLKRDNTVVVPTGTGGTTTGSSSPTTTGRSATTGSTGSTAGSKPSSEGKDSNSLFLIIGAAVVVVGGGAGYWFLRNRSAGGDLNGPKGSNPEEQRLLQFFRAEAVRPLTSVPDASDRETALQAIFTRYRGYPELEKQLKAMKLAVERLNEQVGELTYYKNYSEQPEAFRQQYEKVEADLVTMSNRAATAEAAARSLEETKTTLTREKAELERNLKSTRNDLGVADTLLAQQIEALDALAADLARLKERMDS